MELHLRDVKTKTDSGTDLYNCKSPHEYEAEIRRSKSPTPSEDYDLLEKLRLLPEPSQYIPGYMSSAKDQPSESENVTGESFVNGLDGREGQGDAIIQVPTESMIQSAELIVGAALCSGGRAEMASEVWIQSEAAKDESLQLEGFSAIPVTDSSCCSSYLAVTTPSAPFPDESSPQVSSTSLESSSSCSDDEYMQLHRAARPSRAVDSLASDAAVDGPWITDDMDLSPAVPLGQHDEYGPGPSYYCEGNPYPNVNGYASPASDEDDETYFTCREDLVKKSDTNATFSGDEAVQNSLVDERQSHGSPLATKKASAPSESIQSVEKNAQLNVRRLRTDDLDDISLQNASVELANEILRVSLDAVDASSPYDVAAAGAVLNSNGSGCNESGFYELSPSDQQIERRQRPVNRSIHHDVRINIAETPEEGRGPNDTATTLTPSDIRRPLEIVSETPISISSEISMVLCETPQTPSDLNHARLGLDEDSEFYSEIHSEGHQQGSCVLLASVERKRLNMESMMREAERAREEFHMLRNSINRLIERISSD